MASPFPGMDPYLERFWGDVHHRLITYACDRLQGALPGDLRARVEERVFVESPKGPEHVLYPDIRVVERGRRQGVGPVLAGNVGVAEPLRIHLSSEPVTQGYIEIIDLASGRRVVTVIEVLIPPNEAPGPGRKLYLRKQKECQKGGVNLVEIDLLRAGRWVLAVPVHLVPPSHRTTYRVCVYRAQDDGIGEVYRVPLRERLPVIGIPLRPTDADVPLDLQAQVEQCYRNGGYDEDIDYRTEPDPPLTDDDARWADALLRERGRRAGPAPKKTGPGKRRPRKRDA
jgi:hypothetical protein